jgi:hypothetical protein
MAADNKAAGGPMPPERSSSGQATTCRSVSSEQQTRSLAIALRRMG